MLKFRERNLDGFYEMLAPGSTFCERKPKLSATKRNLIVRNSDIAQFVTREEKDIELSEYAKRRHDKRKKEQTVEHKKCSC